MKSPAIGQLDPTCLPTRIPTTWDTARDTLAALRHHGRAYIAAQILLGWQLTHLKAAHGIAHGTNQHSEKRTSQIGTSSQTWEQTLRQELDLSKSTAYRFEQVYTAFREKLSRQIVSQIGLPDPGYHAHDPSQPAGLLTLLDQPPATLTPRQHTRIADAIRTASDGATQASLLADLQLIRQPPAPIGGDTSDHRKDPPSETEQAELFHAEALDQWTYWTDTTHTLIQSGHLDVLTKPELQDLKQSLLALQDQINLRLTA